MSREERVARNEALFREVNEQIKQVNEDAPAAAETAFVCECGDPECTGPVSLTLVEYEEVRRRPHALRRAARATSSRTSRSSSRGTTASPSSGRTSRRRRAIAVREDPRS